jgi:cation:H+ antiporter
VLFLVATVILGEAVLPGSNASDVYLTSLAALLTLVYVVGLIFRPSKRVAGVGVDSLVALVLYTLGIGGLVAITLS